MGLEQPQDVQHAFSDAGFSDIEVGAEVFYMLGMPPQEIALPHNMQKMKEITSFLQIGPEALNLLRSASIKGDKKNMLDHLASFAMLHKKRMKIKDELDVIERQIGLYE